MPDDARQPLTALAPVGDRVHLVVPPSSTYLRTVRLVAADAAVRAGCDVSEVEDFRIAIDELCHLLMTATDHDVHVTMTTFEDHVVGRGSARIRSGRAGRAGHELDAVSALIVKATSDHFAVDPRRDELVFEVTKRARRQERTGDWRPLASPR
ncbi:MAG TPA: hypothetical protein VFZ17_11005 [Acidimicrobiia bacterium]|nr:hypothetical protein [Acidimicrobiia bacterium]